MRLNFLSFSNLTLLVALSLSSVAAWYSIIGLTAIFAGAVIPVIIMGSILEVGKITTTVWLRKYWHRASWVLKLYLVPAVIALALLTSMGIFGFLSKAHMDQGITSGDVQAKIAIYDEKIKVSQDNIDVNRKALKQLDEAVDQVMGRSTSETGADKAVAIRKSQAKERTRLLSEIAAEQKVIAGLREERAPIAAEVRKVEAEVGPIKYIAALIYGDNTDTNMLEAAVRWVIILLVIVFDPLAIALVLAANASKEWDNDEEQSTPIYVADVGEPPTSEEKAAYEADDGPLTEEQIDQIKESVEVPDNLVVKDDSLFKALSVTDEEEEAFKELEPKPSDPTLDPCYKCGTPLLNAPGIGPFCPNKECDVVDNTDNVEWEYISPAPEKSLLEQHPYLSKPFVSFDVKPMVAPKEEIVAKEPTADEDHTMQVKQDLPYTELEGGYVAFEGKHMSKDALFGMHPEFLKLSIDSAKPVNSGFGPKFPELAEKGDVFTRVDSLPNKVFKYDGRNWIEINKDTTNTYLYNTKYLEYLIEMIDNGQYDPELLSENERAQLEDYVKIQQNNNRKG